MDQKLLNSFDYSAMGDFNSAKAELEKMLKKFYPETYQNYMSGKAGAPIVDMYAFLAEVMSFTNGQMFNQVFPQTVVDYQSAIYLAQAKGQKNFGPSLPWAEVEFKITVPAVGGAINRDYIPKIIPGAIVSSRNPSVPDFMLATQVDFTSVPEDE